MRKGSLFLVCVLTVFGITLQIHADSLNIESAVPSNGDNNAKCNQSVVIDFDDIIDFNKDDVTINQNKDNIADVHIDDDKLTIIPQKQKQGTNYRVEVNGDVILSYTTAFSDSDTILTFNNDTINKFYGGRKLYAKSVEIAENRIVMKNASTQSKGGRFYSADVDINSSDVEKISIGIKSDKDFTGNIYFSADGNYSGFSTENKVSFNVTGGSEFKTYVITTDNDNTWKSFGNIRQFMFESVETGDYTVEISNVDFLKNVDSETSEYRIGAMRICSDYMLQNETDITDDFLNGNKIYGVIDKIKNNTDCEKKAVLIIAYYDADGKLSEARCTEETLNAGEESSMSVSLETKASDGKVKLFLRRGVKDIRSLASSVETKVKGE